MRKEFNPALSDSAVNECFGFSDCEAEITARLIKGMSYNSIRQSLFISLDTVKTYVNRIYRKTGISKRQEPQRVLQNDVRERKYFFRGRKNCS